MEGGKSIEDSVSDEAQCIVSGLRASKDALGVLVEGVRRRELVIDP